MATNVILPALGMAQDTGKIVQWFKTEGDQVQQGDPIAEIETDKVTVELEAPASGVLAQISAQAGDEVPVGQTIAIILAATETPARAAPLGAAIAPEMQAAQLDRRSHASHTDDANSEISGAVPTAVPATNGKRLASQKARRLAAERDVDIAALHGSGPGGAVLAADVLALPVVSPHATGDVVAHDGEPGRVWRLMAERTTQSWTTIPHFFLLREVPARAFVEWHAGAQKQTAEKLTYTDLLVKIVAMALRLHPRLNASWVNGTVVTNPSVNIGIAVAVDDGLLVPVIAHADDLSLTDIARQRRSLVERAHNGKLRPDDLRDGTFTISNLGMYGIDAFSAIINAPQVAILAVGAVVDRIVPVNGLPAVTPAITLNLSCDHRVVDGARGAQFLATVAEFIADPAKCVVEPH